MVNTRYGNKTPYGGTVDGGNRKQGRGLSGNRGRERNTTRFPIPDPFQFRPHFPVPTFTARSPAFFGGGIHIKIGSWPDWTWHVCGGTTHSGQPGAIFGLFNDHDRPKRESTREATAAIAAPTPTAHRTSYPGVAASKKIMAAASPILNQLARPRRTKTDPTSQKHEYFLKGSIASWPSLFRARRLETPSAYPRDREVDGSILWAAKGRRCWRRRARDDASHATTQATRQRKPRDNASRRFCLLSSVFVSRALCDLLRYSDFPHI